MGSVAFIRRLVQKEMSLVPSVRPRHNILGGVAKRCNCFACTIFNGTISGRIHWDVWLDALTDGSAWAYGTSFERGSDRDFSTP